MVLLWFTIKLRTTTKQNEDKIVQSQTDVVQKTKMEQYR